MSRSRADDIEAIRRMIYLYCRSMDRMDKELGYSIWHDGAEADYGETIYQGSGRGFIDFVTESHRPLLAQSHQVTNVIIDLSGDRAASESYVTAALRHLADGQLSEITVRGRYLDRWAFRDGRWGIVKRRYMHDFDEVRPIAATSIAGTSTRDTSDPSYAVLDLDR